MRKINYQLIVSDFDGTLAGRDGKVSEKNRKAIFEYIEEGGIFAISSGRLPFAILPQARELGLRGLLLCGQGTAILEIESGEVLMEERLSMETTLAACRKMEEMGLHVLAFDLWEYYSSRDDEMLAYYERLSGAKGVAVTDRRLSEFLAEKKLTVYKLIALVEPKDNEAVFHALKTAGLSGCDVTRSMDFLVEVVNPIHSKGTALCFLADKYGIPIERTVAVGDNYNDLSMIECAGVGVAVGNAENALKVRADHVCEATNEESAIANVIEKFGFAEA